MLLFCGVLSCYGNGGGCSNRMLDFNRGFVIGGGACWRMGNVNDCRGVGLVCRVSSGWMIRGADSGKGNSFMVVNVGHGQVSVVMLFVVVAVGVVLGARFGLLRLAFVRATASDGDDEGDEDDRPRPGSQPDDPPLVEAAGARVQEGVTAGARRLRRQGEVTVEGEGIVAVVARVAIKVARRHRNVCNHDHSR